MLAPFELLLTQLCKATRAAYRAWYATGHLKLLASVETLFGWISLEMLIAVALAHLL